MFVSDVWLLFDRHHRHGGVNLGGQRDLDLILVAVHTGVLLVNYSTHARSIHYVPDTHALFDVSGRHFLAETDHKLGDLFDIDDVLGVFLAGIDDLSTACDLVLW